MKLKKFIIYALVLSLVFISIGLYFNIPIAFVSNEASSFEYIVTAILISATKAVLILSIIVHVKNTIRLERFYRRKQKLHR